MFSKKAVSEITSFLFITLLIVVSSTTAFFVLKEIFDSQVNEIDRNTVEIDMKKMVRAIDSIKNFENSSTSASLYFRSGQFVFRNNQAYYQSLYDFETTMKNCFNNICYYGVGGYERLYFNLSDSYTFKEEIVLDPGHYDLFFRNLKGASEIEVRFN